MSADRRPVLFSVALVCSFVSSVGASQEADPPCSLAAFMDEPMDPENYSIEIIQRDDVDEFWIHVRKTIGPFELVGAGFRYTEGGELRIAGALDLSELDDTPLDSVTDLLLVARDLARGIEVFANHSEDPDSCRGGVRRFTFPLVASEQN